MSKFSDLTWLGYWRAAFYYFRRNNWRTSSAMRQATLYADKKVGIVNG